MQSSALMENVQEYTYDRWSRGMGHKGVWTKGYLNTLSSLT